jgi:hypothetical protein
MTDPEITLKKMKNQSKVTNEKMATHLRSVRLDQNHTMRSLASILGTSHSFIEFIHYCKALEKDPAVEIQAIMDL